MRSVYATLALAIVSSVQAVPLQKRIQQTIADSLTAWEQACLTAGGGQQCNQVKVTAFTTLLAAAGPCDQQDNADIMINLAKTLNNDPEMIRLTQIFTQQPRNSPNSVSVVYCDKAPQNAELNGLFQCQFQGVNDNLFTNGNTPGQAGTIPFGLSSPVSPPGSCPAHPDGKVPDGQQLVDLVQSPGTPSSNSGGNNQAPVQAAPPAASSDDSNQDAPSTSQAAAAPPPAATTPASTGSGFQADNGRQAQQQNQEFASLTTSSPCTAGENACINQQFAQCVNGAFVLQPCSADGSVICVALPLVNSPGTSITCARPDDATARFAAAGVSGGFDGQH